MKRYTLSAYVVTHSLYSFSVINSSSGMEKAIKLLRSPGIYNYTVIIEEMLQISGKAFPNDTRFLWIASSMVPRFLLIGSSDSEELMRYQCGINWVSIQKKLLPRRIFMTIVNIRGL